jgi:hypothetical protein
LIDQDAWPEDTEIAQLDSCQVCQGNRVLESIWTKKDFVPLKNKYFV